VPFIQESEELCFWFIISPRQWHISSRIVRTLVCYRTNFVTVVESCWRAALWLMNQLALEKPKWDREEVRDGVRGSHGYYYYYYYYYYYKTTTKLTAL